VNPIEDGLYSFVDDQNTNRWYKIALLPIQNHTNNLITFVLDSSRVCTDFSQHFEPAYDIFVLQFRPKKQQFLVALPTP